MANLILKVEILAGTDIEQACNELCMLAKKLDIAIESSFNEVRLLAFPHTHLTTMIKGYYNALERTP